jgi:gliding motility-associated-like protein
VINPNTSTDKDPHHKFSDAGIYNVRLTVTSKDGCEKDTVQHFTVNGSTPVPRFAMQQTKFCSGDSVIIEDSSSVLEFGNILRLEIYWDYENDPSVKTIDDNPSVGKLYKHEYPVSVDHSAINYHLRYIAYSGINCLNEITKEITIFPSPKIQFDPLVPVCEEIKPFQLSQAREIYGLPGIGNYSGPGVIAEGLFNPSSARPGDHTLRYSFNAANGCAAFKEEMIRVFPTPYVDAGPDRTIFEGGFITLVGKGRGYNVNYLWTPNLSIDNIQLPTPKISPADDITYRLTVTSSDGCKATDEVFVKVLRELRVPNAFSPNNDGINDKWEIQYLESYPGCTVEVYNRFGQIVFRSAGYNPSGSWDGTLNGKPLPMGTYYWIINPKNGRKQMNGSVTIVR